MGFRRFQKGSVYLVGFGALKACSLIVRCLPQGWLYGFARGVASCGYFFASKQRKIALESLGIAFGSEKSPDQLRSIAKDCFISMAKSAVEILYLLDKPRLLQERIVLSGKEHLQAALAKERGVILVSAHFGNFPLLLGRLSREGYQTAGIMRPMKDKRTEEFFRSKRQRLNIQTIYSQPRNLCVETTIRTLRQNGVVFIPLDQNFGSGGVFVDFFGQRAATATGPVVLAQRTKAAILPCFIIRQEDDTQRIVFEPELELKEAPSAEETIMLNIQRLTTIIEAYIRRYPAEWGWIHRRWKARPRG
jgi:KDO2-lipid IV(A) lauroyltransferase